MQILDGIWLIDQLRGTNAYIVAVGDGAVLVDTGFPGKAQLILDTLNQQGYTAAQVRAIVATHAQIDHIGNVAKLQQRTGAPVYASAGEASAIEGHVPLPYPPGLHGLPIALMNRLRRPHPAPVEVVLEPGKPIPHMPGWRVIATPGHTPDHISLYHPEREFLLAGDAVVNLGGPRRSPWIVTSLMPLAKASVALLAGLPLQSAAFGHGRPIINDPTLSLRLAHIAQADRSRNRNTR